MSTKRELQKQITEVEKEMEELEQKRLRSLATLMEAMVDKKEPEETDVKFFKTLSSLISMSREKLRALNEELANVK